MIPKKIPTKKEIIAALDGRSQREAAKLLGTNPKKLRTFMRNYDIKSRTPQEAIQLDRRYKCATPHVSSRKQPQIHFKLITEVDRLKHKPTINQCKGMAIMPFSHHDVAGMWETREYRRKEARPTGFK